MTDPYLDFLARKSASRPATGFDPGADFLATTRHTQGHAPRPHQVDVTRWALRRGRAALFLDTGLGKTLCQLAWARAVAERTGGRVLVLAPLAVAEQTVAEAAAWGIRGVEYRREEGPASLPITVTNYEMLEHFDAGSYVGVVLDESSILKSFNGGRRVELTEAFARTPYRLCCTATPAPNDFTELGNHSDFLGIKTQKEMQAEYFIHDGANRALSRKEVSTMDAGGDIKRREVYSSGDWRLKGHARDAFWRWVCSWGALVKRPSDLGHSDDGYILPPLRMHEHVIPVDHYEARERGLLFADDASSLADQRKVRRDTMPARVAKVAELASGDESVLVWCELNDEADAVEAAIAGAVQVAGNDDRDVKRSRMIGFATGEHRVLVTKPKVAGFGMNWQHCRRVIFAGASHSYESTYQAIRRCWRFGQTRPVDVHIVRAETEGAIVENFKRKERDAERMAEAMGERMRDVMASEINGADREWKRYDGGRALTLPAWLGGGR